MSYRFVSVGILSFALVGFGMSETKQGGEEPLPESPADHVLDEARLIDPETRAKLVAEIQRLEREAGVDLFIAAYTLLPEPIEDRARRLREAWATNHRTVVCVYRRGAQQLTFSASGDGKVFVPSQTLFALYDRAVEVARQHDEPRDRLVAATRSLSEGLIEDLKVRDSKRGPFVGEVFRLLIGLMIASLTIGGISYAIVKVLNGRRQARDAGFLFPEVVVGRRLGAAFGGGTVAEIDFQKNGSHVTAQAPGMRQPRA